MAADSRRNVVIPDELWERVGREAERSAGGNKSYVVRRALEEALGGLAPKGVPGEDARVSPARLKSDSSYPASPRASEPEPRCTCFDRGRQPGDDPKCYFHGKRSVTAPTI